MTSRLQINFTNESVGNIMLECTFCIVPQKFGVVVFCSIEAFIEIKKCHDYRLCTCALIKCGLLWRQLEGREVMWLLLLDWTRSFSKDCWFGYDAYLFELIIYTLSVTILELNLIHNYFSSVHRLLWPLNMVAVTALLHVQYYIHQMFIF